MKKRHPVYREFVRPERDAFSVSPPPSRQTLTKQREDSGSRGISVREFLETADRLHNDRQTSGQKVALKATALLDIQRRLGSFREADFANPQARAAYRYLRAQQELYERQRSEQKVQPAAGNKSYYNPTGRDYAASKYGGMARLSGWLVSGFMPRFKNPASVLPCVERLVRREVLFANKKAGKGYHTRKRRTWSSGIPC